MLLITIGLVIEPFFKFIAILKFRFGKEILLLIIIRLAIVPLFKFVLILETEFSKGILSLITIKLAFVFSIELSKLYTIRRG